MRIHSRDKRMWFAAHFGRGYSKPPASSMPGLAFGLAIPLLLITVFAAVCVIHAAAPECGMGLALVVPFSIKELRQRRADLKNRIDAVLATVDSKTGFTAEQRTKVEDLRAQNKANEELLTVAEEQLEADRRLNSVEIPDNARIEVAQPGFAADPKGGFKDHRDFLCAVMDATTGRRMDPRLRRYQATQGSDEQGVYSDPYGGYLVPISVAPGILSIAPEDDPIAALVRRVPMRTPQVKFNARVDKNHSSSVSGGLTVTRRPETVDGTSSRMAFEPVEMNAHELFGLAYATETILTDSPESFVAILQAGFSDEFGGKAIDERINGSGTGEPLGVLSSGCKVQVSKETNQAAATILTENIDKMIARSWKYGRAVWSANHNTRPQLAALSRAVGTGGTVVNYFQPAAGANGQDLLVGRPIYFTEYCKTLGTVGDLILVVWSEYLEGEYQPLQSAESIHVRFIANERAFKFWKRNDGQPWWRAALTPKNGDTLSPVVVLQTR